ncbi:MAG TPA: hypothetical protein VHL12_05440, partial [Gemmatimonadaceae bacterium]|nr:hypothetical protein [Gemmatimonadaceae bacterium]
LGFSGTLLFQQQVCDDLPEPLILVAQFANFAGVGLARQLVAGPPPVERRLGDPETTTYLDGGSAVPYLC